MGLQVVNKHRNFKDKHKSAVDWRKKTGEGVLLESGVETVQQYLLKLCPFFDDLDEIYGHWICNNIPFRMQIGNEATIEEMQGESSESIEDENLIELSNQETSQLPLPFTEETLKTKSNVREKKNNQLFVLG